MYVTTFFTGKILNGPVIFQSYLKPKLVLGYIGSDRTYLPHIILTLTVYNIAHCWDIEVICVLFDLGTKKLSNKRGIILIR